MNFFSVWRLRKKWKHAQKIHDEEHETGLTLSLSCEAVGHFAMGDTYSDWFDGDNQRKFLREYRPAMF